MRNNTLDNYTNELLKKDFDEINSLKKKIRDAKFFLSTIADELQYNHGVNDPVYQKVIEAIEDDTKWSI